VIVSGARGSGKTHVLKAVRAELLIRGIHVVDISDEFDYEELVGPASIQAAEEDGEGIDPGSLIIDRFVRGWEQLVARSEPVGVVVVADGVENSSKEVVEFFSYVCKRLEHGLEEDVAPKIYLLITGRSPHLKRDLDSLLPHGQTDEYMIPPPRSPDIEAVLSMFYGHMSGTGEREMLRQHLVKSAETTDLLLSRLKTAFVRGHLIRSAGKWSFLLPDADVRASVDDEPSYYQVLFGQLPDDERTLIAALCTHIEPLSLADLKAISGLTETRIAKALDRLSPYRVVERIHDAEADVVGLASESLREAFYRGVGEEERRKYHSAYIDYYRAASVAPLQRHRLLAFHYERSGMVREALVCKISALREMRPRRDLFEIREVCSKTIDAVEKLQSREWRSRRWHLKRYFIKRWMEAEWEANNYAAIVDIIDTHILGDRRLVPLSLCYRYGTALEKLGNLQACRRLIKSARRRAAAAPQSTICELSVLEASYYFARGDYVAALKTLDLMEPALESAGPSLVARAFVLYMLCYEGVGNRTGYERFLSKAKEAALAAGDSDQLLAINYSTIMSHLNSSMYETARSELKESIRMAHRRRAYDKLSSMYFLASAVYYEEGRYRRALRYLDKAVRVGVNMNMAQRVTDYMLRYAFIYQNMGQYGNAIRFAETARKRAAEANHDGQYFFALLILFDLHTSTSQSKASAFVAELKQLAASVKAKYQIALFHRLLGEFSLAQSLEDDAIHEFQTASRMYQSIGYDDDAARCQMRVAMVYTRRGDRKRSQQILRQVDERVYTMESQDLIAESYLAHLDHYRVFGYKRHMFIGMLKLCDDIRPKISDINVALRMDALLHKCYSHLGDGEKQVHYLRSFHAIVRDIVSGLHDSEMIAQFLANEEVSAMLARYRALEGKKPEYVPV
jgi:tetratricopeptide (TPR) repeat protein